MKSSYLMTMALTFTFKALGSPTGANGPAHPGPKTSRYAAGIVTAPLFDWIKNGQTDLQWYTTISVGTPPQNFTVLIDTGSQAILLPQSNCTSCSAEQRKFDPSASSTFSWSPLGSAEPGFSTGGDTVPFSEPQGAQCNFAVDDVFVQGLTAPAFPFLLCYDEGSAMASQPGIDGILGLSINASGSPRSLQWALQDAGLLDSGMFGLYTPSGQVIGGELTLGGVDETKFEGELTWIPLDLLGHTTWTVNMQTIFVNGKQLRVSIQNNTTTSSNTVPYPQSIVQVLDSGSAFIMAPDNATAAALYAQISADIYQIDLVGTWGCSCVDMATIVHSGAELTFLLGYDGSGAQLNVTIPSSIFNLGPYPGQPDICQAVVNSWSDGVYFEGNIGLWMLGSPLLKNYYTAWDGMNLQVGFAPLKGASAVDNSATAHIAAATPKRAAC